MIQKQKCIHSIFIAVIALGLLLVGCDNSIDPLDENKGLYSIYGGLDVNAEENFIRVKNLNEPIVSTASDSLDAEVRLHSVDKNTSEKLRFVTAVFDSIKTFNYRATMNIDYDSVYEVIVEKPDGRQVTATAQTPPLADVTILPAPEDRTCGSNITVIFDPVVPGEVVFVDVRFEYNENKYWFKGRQALRIGTSDKTKYSFSLPIIIESRIDPNLGPYEFICDYVTSNEVAIRYRHLGKGYLLKTSTDSLNIPDEAKNLVGYYDKLITYKFKWLNK